MKTVIAIVVIIVIAAAGYNIYKSQNTVTQDEFHDYRKEFRAEIDSIKTELRDVAADVDTLKFDTDTLKRGQEVIYKEVRKVNSKQTPSFWDNF